MLDSSTKSRLRLFLWVCWVISALLPRTSLSNALATTTLTELAISETSSAQKRIQAWQQLIHQGQYWDNLKRIQRVNAFFNSIPFKSDTDHWQQQDYWATPLELLISYGGDCEDYAIAKYMTLRSMGIADEQLRITYVAANGQRQAHMVLAFYPLNEKNHSPWILDNILPTIHQAKHRTDLTPVYSFNGEELRLERFQGRSPSLGHSSELTVWQELHLRFRHQLELRQDQRLF